MEEKEIKKIKSYIQDIEQNKKKMLELFHSFSEKYSYRKMAIILEINHSHINKIMNSERNVSIETLGDYILKILDYKESE
ncbi:MAG TPA: hypothetical protein PLP33_29310 [Leptospiraceae bacterium]|nr:hypothetical protein [Leptospiraceae bacterium]HMZ67035.1 hypothetical protein [Leptospiraceae bacterium]HNA10246.1 hypothetical protein [Leptospiraceae bacterium]HNC59562.1 hypothetical protein [Leptospiraceae bacterium]HNE11404.1 hypothetical protein [Leptospiraceae bacterium]